MSDFKKVGQLKDFPENQTVGKNIDGVDICLVNLAGKISAFDDSCTHAEALLSRSELDEGDMVCPLHGARFDPMTGQAKTLPAVRPLRKHDVKIEGDQVFVKLNN